MTAAGSAIAQTNPAIVLVDAGRAGLAAARALLVPGRCVQVLDDRLFIAGEACHTEWAAQVPGARLSERRAAEQIRAM